MSTLEELTRQFSKIAEREIYSPEEEEGVSPDLGQSLREHKLEHEVASLKQQLKEDEDVHELRLSYTSKVFWLVCIWLIFVAVVICCTGFSLCSFALSDKVLITFITSTTVTVLGLFVIVAKWMFPVIQGKNNNS